MTKPSAINTGAVFSKDGTKISYRTVGHGPALIVVPGALAVAADFDTFADELGRDFTVHTIERRGRGLSGPKGQEYSVHKECEDLEALQRATEAQYLFGHSFGGFITLEAARNNKGLKKIAVYEPGVSIDGSIPLNWVPKCQSLLGQEQYLDAFVTFVRGINPESSGKVPHWLLRMILPLVISEEKRRQDYELLPGTFLEHGEEMRLNNTYQNYKEISAEILLMSGKPVGYLPRTVAKLALALPRTRVASFPRLDHFGPEKNPHEVAQAVATFVFSEE